MTRLYAGLRHVRSKPCPTASAPACGVTCQTDSHGIRAARPALCQSNRRTEKQTYHCESDRTADEDQVQILRGVSSHRSALRDVFAGSVLKPDSRRSPGVTTG